MKTKNTRNYNTKKNHSMPTYQKRADTMERFFRNNDQRGILGMAYIDLCEKFEFQYRN
ncbi:MAG: hypothetical protein VW455_06755 [Nitrospinota bacterium]